MRLTQWEKKSEEGLATKQPVMPSWGLSQYFHQEGQSLVNHEEFNTDEMMLPITFDRAGT